jgi:glycosyltransferase involved in cell wall biosynthesis
MNYPDNWKKMNVLLCHDWLTGMRGGERVLEILCNGFPDATLFTLFHNKSAISDIINSHEIRTSHLQSLPGIMKYYRNLLPLFPGAIERMNTPDADLLISTNHCVAKGLKQQPGTKHICYCFTPMRYAWTFYNEYFGANPLKSLLAKPILPAMRKWDRGSADRVDSFVAISKHVQKRIKKFYDRDSDIVYPPVNTEYWTPGDNADGEFDLVVSAMVPYKRVDLAVQAYTKLGYPLKIVGIGGELQKLKAMAGNNVEFLEWQSDENILKLYRSCRMLIFPGEEDFGIVPLEAQSCGRPVVAYEKGGALETIDDNVSGVFFKEQTVNSLLEAVERSSGAKWDQSAIRNKAENFSTQNFVDNLGTVINKLF